MKNKKIIILLGVVVIAAVAVIVMVLNGTIILDRSGERLFENGLRWKDNEYVATAGKYHEGKTIAKTNDGFQICEIEGDDSHTFVGLRSLLDNWLLVREDYVIPIDGEITMVYWNLNFIGDEEFLVAVTDVLKQRTPEFVYDNSKGDIYQYKGDDVMREFVVAYEDCPVPTNYMGYMGTIDGRWCITVGNYQKDKIDCWYIPEKYTEVLEEYWT